MQTPKERIAALIKRGILVSPDLLDAIARGENPEIPDADDLAVVNKDVVSNPAISAQAVNFKELEAARALAEKNNNDKPYKAFLSYIGTGTATQEADETPRGSVSVLFSYSRPPTKRTPKDFVSYFSRRYRQLERILSARSELSAVVSIGKIPFQGGQRQSVAFIGLVREKQLTKNGNLLLSIEDPTGTVRVIITKNKTALFAQARDIVFDAVLGFVGATADKAIFAQSIFWPDIPFDHALRTADRPGYAAFISDIHVGSTQFLPEEFERFLKWLNGEAGSPAQREIAANLDYLFIVGDLVDGVGVYPNQKRELAITDIYEQYRECARLLARIPRRIRLIICPGNHDAMRLAEPQPAFTEDFAKPLHDLPNAIIVSNPSYINIHASDTSPGIDVLLYHGYSFDYYVAEVDSIRSQGGYDRADLIMKFLLQHRHVAPSYGSTLYLPDPHKDNLVIDRIPDVFVSGHIHKSSVSAYRNITLISGSCWQGMTSFQEKMGHHPEPARVPVVNLQTRDVKVLKFGS